VPAVPSCILDPLREQFLAVLPPRVQTHPLGCHRRRIDDRIVFDKLVEALGYGAGYERLAMASARRRRCADAGTSGYGWAGGIGCGWPAWTPTTR
jgi:hypothetical protein